MFKNNYSKNIKRFYILFYVKFDIEKKYKLFASPRTVYNIFLSNFRSRSGYSGGLDPDPVIMEGWIQIRLFWRVGSRSGYYGGLDPDPVILEGWILQIVSEWNKYSVHWK